MEAKDLWTLNLQCQHGGRKENGFRKVVWRSRRDQSFAGNNIWKVSLWGSQIRPLRPTLKAVCQHLPFQPFSLFISPQESREINKKYSRSGKGKQLRNNANEWKTGFHKRTKPTLLFYYCRSLIVFYSSQTYFFQQSKLKNFFFCGFWVRSEQHSLKITFLQMFAGYLCLSSDEYMSSFFFIFLEVDNAYSLSMLSNQNVGVKKFILIWLW